MLIAAEGPGDVEGAISAASLAELYFGTLRATTDDERARRVQRLGVIEATFDPLPSTRCGARMGATGRRRRRPGAQPRRRAIDLAIAATANVHRAPLLTHDVADFAVIDDLVDVRSP